MDLLERLLGHHAWTTGQLLAICGQLTDVELDRQFDIGHRSIRATLQHMIRNMEVWANLMASRLVEPPSSDASIQTLRVRLDRAAENLKSVALEVSRRARWDERWLDVLDHPPKEKTFGGAIAHVVTHSMHDRGQLLYMLRQLGFKNLPEGDVLSWEEQLTKASGRLM
jgi:uncharacterized damage-inducible protein DinB